MTLTRNKKIAIGFGVVLVIAATTTGIILYANKKKSVGGTSIGEMAQNEADALAAKLKGIYAKLPFGGSLPQNVKDEIDVIKNKLGDAGYTLKNDRAVKA